jgi:septum formation protein
LDGDQKQLKLILASQSPRRKEILRRAGFAFEVRVSNIPELLQPGEGGRAYVTRLSKQKAAAVARNPDELVLAADTVVVVDDQILEKPVDRDHAISMLKLLSDRPHQVLTGVALTGLALTGEELQNIDTSFVEATTVWFAPLSDQEIDWYASTSEPYDKAGAYALQGLAGRFVTRIEGDYQNVIGLPLHRLYVTLRDLNLLQHLL